MRFNTQKERVFAINLCAAQASNRGGTIVVRLGAYACVAANFTASTVAAGNSDHNSAIVPVTKGAAALVPPDVSDLPASTPRLVMPSPGALKPRLPIEFPRLD